MKMSCCSWQILSHQALYGKNNSLTKLFLCLFYFLFSQALGIFHLTIPASDLSSYTVCEQGAQRGVGLKAKEASHSSHLTP